ncbi:hypothetical protein G7043_28010 [Lentzea sp. NEAU-D13]|uniref:Uncharacterized protein n=1 Tax=Lentzea alba TaxID=2714351 RepID=A0A7C9RTY1_9PSEU|nr:hypothetical protein [Lentzea alba]NGY62768.1 hypothetical protein [Lentzea alba]
MARRDGDSSLELPELRKIWARSHSGEWDGAAAERVLRDGIEALDGPFGKLSRTEAALILFNLDAHAEPEADYPAVLGRLGRMAGIAGDVAIRARTGELRRSLAAVLVGQDIRIKVESRDNVASLLANLDAVEAPAGRRRVVKPATAAVALVSAVVVVVGATLVVAKLVRSGGPNEGGDLKSTSASSEPVKIQNVTVFQNRVRDLRYALSEPVAELPPPGAPAANETAESFDSWYQKHGGTALGSGYTNITVQGNDSKPVHITDMKIDAQCSVPLDGAFLQGYTAGGEHETIKIGFNLDDPKPFPEQMTTLDDGLQGMGRNYFSAHTIELGPGETEVLTVGAYTKNRYCKFKLQLVVATANGTVVQDVDARDKRFEVTGLAPKKNAEALYSGYQKVYRQDVSLSWKAVDPNSPEGP